MAPVALGEGVHLFTELDAPLVLRLVGPRTFADGVVMLDLAS